MMTTESLATLKSERDRCAGITRLVIEAALRRSPCGGETHEEIATLGAVLLTLIRSGMAYDAAANRPLQEKQPETKAVDA